MDYEPTEREKILLDIFKESGAINEESGIEPGFVIEQAREAGLKNPKIIDDAIMSLIDHDVVEYDMDEQAEVSTMWLMTG